MADEPRTSAATGPAERKDNPAGSAKTPEKREGDADRARRGGAPPPPAPDAVEEASRESFPASDPPAWTGTSVE